MYPYHVEGLTPIAISKPEEADDPYCMDDDYIRSFSITKEIKIPSPYSKHARTEIERFEFVQRMTSIFTFQHDGFRRICFVLFLLFCLVIFVKLYSR